MSFPKSPFSGFPFDDDFDRDRTSFRTQLDDIAQRHPEFAQHLSFGNEFPFRGRRRSNDRQQPPPEAEFGRRHERPFGSRFEEFGFPFRRHFDEPDFYQEGPPPPQPQPTEKEVPREQEEKKPEEPEKVEQELPKAQENPEVRKQNIQQSNTVDLGKNQEPLDDQRGQRSMSAPPENRPAQQRFVSSINIPIHTQTGGGDMGARASQPESQKPTERVIPIHVEGRDEPVLPRNANFTPPPSQPQQQYPPQPHQQQQQPQADRIFGRNPSHFTQFLNKGEPQMTPDDFFKQQQKNYQKQQQPNFQQQQAPPAQQQAPPAQQQAPPAQEAPEEPQPQEEPPKASKPGQIEQIQSIQKDVSELMNQVEKFEGKPRDKQYLYLDEMLTRNLIKLDNIETEGKENIRQARKEAIKCIEGCIGILEAKANANEARAKASQADLESKMEVATAPEEKVEEKIPEDQAPVVKPEEASLEVSGVSRSGTIVSTAEVTPMEVAEVAAPAEEKKVEEKMEEVVDQPTEPTESGEVASPPMEDKPEEKKEKKKGKKKDKVEKK